MKNEAKRGKERDGVIEQAEVFLANREENPSVCREEYRKLLTAYGKLYHKLLRIICISDKYQRDLKEKEGQLKKIRAQLDQLKDIMLPVCMYCKKVRTDGDYWEKIESFFARHVEVMFSHGICPDCIRERFGEGPERSKRLRQLINQMGVRETKGKIPPVPATDPTLTAMKTLLDDPSVSGNPLYPHLEKFSDKYGKLLARLNKILIISDSYQAQLRELNMRLETMARTDMLTGLANRWDMIEKLARERSRASRRGSVFSLIMIDIDKFKGINDRFGHEIGDRCLIKIAHTLRSCIRKEDDCARWGGEEFLILLPETELEAAVAKGRKLVELIANLHREDRKLPVKITVSAGVSAFNKVRTIDQCVALADQAMYAAKAAGGNDLSFLP